MKLVTDEALLRKPSSPISLGKGLDLGRKMLNFLLILNKDKKKKGIGLSAPQVGVHSQVCVFLYPRQFVLINPSIVAHSHVMAPAKEGCLSFPTKEISTYRWLWIDIVCENLPGVQSFGHKEPYDNKTFLESVVVQHESDHLAGVLFFDRTEDKSENYIGLKL